MSGAGATRTAPPRPPDGWFLQHPRYRWYVAFAGTGIFLALAVAVLLLAVRALGRGYASWQAFASFAASPPGLLLNGILLVVLLFFAIRWLRVGAKIPAVRLGPVPPPAMELILIAHFAGFVALSALVLLVVTWGGWL